MTEAAKKARLRRICERKPSGKIHCPEWLHEQWVKNSDRDDMVAQLEKCNWQKAHDTSPCCISYRYLLAWQKKFIKTMTVIHEKLNQRRRETTKGWYSRAEMVSQLTWDESGPE